MKEKAMQLVKKASNEELQATLEKFGKKVKVNGITRGFVVAGIEKELGKYSNEDIEKFLNDNFPGWQDKLSAE